MDVQSQLLFIGSSAKIFKLWWQNERGFADWKQRNQHTRGVPLPPYRREKGGERVPDTQNKNFAYRLCFLGLRQPAGNVASMRRIVFHPLVVKHTK
ncbi:TPA: hypothetical protein JI295_17115 [Acinetobacter baumannii]|nr:hypothetical protein [Acinetobacter baumannii]